MDDRVPANISDDDQVDVRTDDTIEKSLPSLTPKSSELEAIGSKSGEKVTLEERKADHQMRMEENTFNVATVIILACIGGAVLITMFSSLLDPGTSSTALDLLKSLALLTAGYQFSERRHKNN